MYVDSVQRTQIYLDDAETSALVAASARTGANRSELIRRAIRATYCSPNPDQVDEPSFGTPEHAVWVAAQLDAIVGSAGPGPGTDEWMHLLRGE